MVTDKDIVAALNGEPTGSDKKVTEGILNALTGGPTLNEKGFNNAVLEVLGGAPKGEAASGLPTQRRGDSLEPVAIWAATEAATTSTKALAEALMRADGTKGIFAAEAEAKEIAAEAYAEAAKGSPYEDKRQEAVARIVTKLAEKVTRTSTREAKQQPTAPARAGTRLESAVSKRVRINEGGSGRITVIHK
jgi:hypothetical protein